MTRFESNKMVFGLAAVVCVLGLTLAFSMIAPSPALAQEEFKYGAVSPVTGPIPQFGEYCIRASTLAFEDLEKSGWIGGKKIKFNLEDGKNDPKISLAALNKLINIDKVPIFETVGSSVVLALGPVAQKEKVILMNVAAQTPAIRKIGNFIFSLVPLADRVMEATVRWAVEGAKAKTAVIMHVNNEYGRGVASTFTTLFEKSGGKVLATEIHAQGETDYTTHLTKLKFVKTDLIFFVGHENELGYALKKGKEMGIKTQWFCGPAVFNPLTLQIAGDAAEGIQAADYLFDPENGTERMKEFSRRYKQRFGLLPSNTAPHTYDSIMLYAAALKSGAATSEQIRDYFLSIKNYDGVSGPITFDKDGVTLEEPIVRMVKDGKIVPIK